jgi:hypothetical protein
MPFRAAFALTLALLAGRVARAEILPTLPLRELTIRADVIVVAEPLDTARAGRFRVTRLLKGAAPRPGAEMGVEGLDRYVRSREQLEWAGVDAVLLFLRSTEDGRLDALESGIRLHTRDRKVWWPVQPVNPGGYRMTVEAATDWDQVLARVQADASDVTHLRRACDWPFAARRDRFLLEWVERHRNQFTDGRDVSWLRYSPAVSNLGSEEVDVSDLQASGWGELQLLPFARVLRGRVPADCWQAVNLFAELNQGATPPGANAAFADRPGRAWLLAVASDLRQLEGHRARALRVLADATANGTEPPDMHERTDLLDQLLPLLVDADPKCRGLAARAARQAAAHQPELTERAVSVLSSAYKAEQPGPARNAMAESLYELAGPGRWAKVAGRPNGNLSFLQDAGIREDKLYFWVTLKTDPAAMVTVAPTLIWQRLDSKGAVAETKKVRVTLPSSPGNNGWNGGPMHVELIHTDLRTGNWRFRVTGVAGPDKRPWESEPRTLRVAVSGSSRPRAQRSVWSGILQAVTGNPDPLDEPVAPESKAKRTVELDGEAF